MADVAEEEVTPFLPPYRSLGRALIGAETAGQLFYFLVAGDEALQLWRELLDRHGNPLIYRLAVILSVVLCFVNRYPA